MRRIVLVTCLIAPPLAVVAGWIWGGWWEGLLLLPPVVLYLWATLVPGCAWWGPVLNSFPTRHREVLLTFDDGPDPIETPQVLDLLDTEHAKGLFFITGQRALQYPALVREIVDRGHAIGVHPLHYQPATFWRLLPGPLRQEVEEGLAAVKRVLPAAYALRWFRVPGGRCNPWLHPLLATHSMELMGCSACDDGRKMRDFDATVIRLRRDIGQGGLVCLHHGQTDKEGQPTLVDLVTELLQWLRGQSYKLGE